MSCGRQLSLPITANGNISRRPTTCSQSAPLFIVVLHASPSAAKSAERMEGAMMAAGAISKGLDNEEERGRYERPINARVAVLRRCDVYAGTSLAGIM